MLPEFVWSQEHVMLAQVWTVVSLTLYMSDERITAKATETCMHSREGRVFSATGNTYAMLDPYHACLHEVSIEENLLRLSIKNLSDKRAVR